MPKWFEILSKRIMPQDGSQQHASTMEGGGEYFKFSTTILCSRAYPQSFLRAVSGFQEVTRAQWSQLLAQSHQRKCNVFFKTYWACILTLSNAPESYPQRADIVYLLGQLSGFLEHIVIPCTELNKGNGRQVLNRILCKATDLNGRLVQE